MADAAELLFDEWGCDEGEAGSDQDRDEHETDLSIVVMIQFCEDDRIGEEKCVKHSVD